MGFQIVLIASQLLMAFEAPAYAEGSNWKPTDSCKEISERLPSRLVKVMQAHPKEALLMAQVAISSGYGMGILGIKVGAQGRGQVHFSEFAKDAVKSGDISNDFEQKLIAQLIDGKNLTIDQVIENAAAQGSRRILLGRIATTVGSGLIVGGLLTAVTELFVSGTEPLQTEVGDDPTLLVRPEKIQGGNTALCTAYHFESEKMKASEDKLVKNFDNELSRREKAKYDFAEYRQQHPMESDGRIKPIFESVQTTPADATAVQTHTVGIPK